MLQLSLLGISSEDSQQKLLQQHHALCSTTMQQDIHPEPSPISRVMKFRWSLVSKFVCELISAEGHPEKARKDKIIFPHNKRGRKDIAPQKVEIILVRIIAENII